MWSVLWSAPSLWRMQGQIDVTESARRLAVSVVTLALARVATIGRCVVVTARRIAVTVVAAVLCELLASHS